MQTILVITNPLSISDLECFRGNPYDSMIKYVVDIKKEIISIGGEMHSDSEEILLKNGSDQNHLWGANIYPWSSPIEIEYTSLINIRPNVGNKSLEIQDEEIRKLVKKKLIDGFN